MSKLRVPFNIDSDYSESFIDFYRKQPKWIIKYGLILILLLLCILFLLSVLIKYPDKINSRVTITSVNAPVFVTAKVNGVVDSILVSDSRKVKKNDVIAIIKNNVDYRNYLFLKKTLLNNQYDSILDQNLSLGSIQDKLNNFIYELKKKEVKNLLDEFNLENQTLKNTIFEQKLIINSIHNKIKFLNDEINFESKKINRYRSLYSKGVISQQQLEDYEKDFLRIRQNLEDNKKLVFLSRSEIINIQKTIDENKIRDSEFDLIQKQNIENTKAILVEEIEKWEEQYLLRAPINGTLFFHNFLLTQDKNISAKEEVFSIVPDNPGDLFCVLRIPFNSSGKVKISQRVNVFLDNYPSHEYGILKGEIASIANVPNEEGYLAKVNLINDMQTTYKKSIDFNPNLVGRGEIITEDLSVLKRIFNKFLNLIENT